MKRVISVILLLSFMSSTTFAVQSDKTLVSWVTVNDLYIKAGSILTIQAGEEFDGIVFGELETGVWIAGSDFWNRTNTELKTSAPETENSLGKMIQMAIIYEGDEIRIYRNGELYSNYRAANIDLLNRENNFVVFGMRHLGGDGSISGAIEDTRIYNKALSLNELNELEPNSPSAIEPYAWWDFEGDEIKERTGTYVNHNMGEAEDVRLEEGKLILNRYGSLISTRKYEPETPAWPDNPPDTWLTYHLAHPGPGVAEPGDPNPAYFHKGRYHLHYIYNNMFGFSYAHVSSADMVHWKWHQTVLTPPFTGHGMFSGTGFFTKEGQPVMIYHGAGSGRNHLSYALDDLLEKWSRPAAIEPRNEDGVMPDINHWDPDCWLNGDTYYALSGGKDPELMKSEDLKNWKYLGKVLHNDYPDNLGVKRDEDISCANMFKIGEKWMLLCISHRLGCRYFLGDFKDEKYLPEFHAKMNWINTDWEGEHGGLVYFAPESMIAADGRRVMWAWLITTLTPTGIQSLPRELELPDDGVLRMRSLRELETLRYGEIIKKNIVVNKNKTHNVADLKGDAVELEVTFSAPLPEEFGIDLLADANGKYGLRITAGAKRKTLGVGSIEPPFELKEDEDLMLRIFLDKNLVEVFANDRQAAAVAHKHIRENPNISFFTKDSELTVEHLKAWRMKSCY